MTPLWNALATLGEFLETGGNVLLWILVVTVLMWTLIVERLLYFRRQHPKLVAAVMPPDVAGRWAVDFEQDEEPAVAVFRQDGRNLAGTFLTATGDYRYLAGTLSGDRLRLSCFDGAHAFLFDARLRDDGSLRGDFWSRDSWHDTWTARRDPQATLADGFAQTGQM